MRNEKIRQLPLGQSSDDEKQMVVEWFEELRDLICRSFEMLEDKCQISNKKPARFEKRQWERSEGGGGVMSIMYGSVFEKVGVNLSTVHGKFSDEFATKIPGASKNKSFWASGISVVAHPYSPRVPIVHMNTRHIVTTCRWFGGGTDLTPVLTNDLDAALFHGVLKETCDEYDPDYYDQFKTWCDEYFFIPHRNEMRGIGGIFYDYLNSDNWNLDFEFTQSVGRAFLEVYPEIVSRHMDEKWTPREKEQQMAKRGRYVEFNLLYDRGTQFGLKTGGNVDAILMSMPPIAKWP